MFLINYDEVIYSADLSPSVGSEQSGFRPVLVLQNNIGNCFSPTIIIAAITGVNKKSQSFLPIII